MEEKEKKIRSESGGQLSNRIVALVDTAKKAMHGVPKSAGNKSFRKHNNLRFMITERRRELRKTE